MAKAPSEETTAGMWRVRDRNARLVVDGKVQPRMHEVRLGVTYNLYFNEWTPMPEADARVFLRDEAFEVEDDRGNPVRPLDEAALKRIAPAVLAPELVIARVEELTTEALVTRASMKAGGARFTASTPREVLVAFLVDAEREAQGGRRRDSGTGNDAMAEDMDHDEARSMLEGEFAKAG